MVGKNIITIIHCGCFRPARKGRNVKGPVKGPVRVGAHMGPKDTILFEKRLILMKNDKIVNKNIKGVKSEKIKVKTWFGDKDLSS